MAPDRRLSISRLITMALIGASAAAAAYTILRERRRMDFRGKTVLISGASRGLGLELARGFAR
ncbi:MAG TPA: ketoacyl reductase, partial [Candidatus Binatia bacterium]|nr:ketoacyl reductase [Candidatus Binatia bacterium]